MATPDEHREALVALQEAPFPARGTLVLERVGLILCDVLEALAPQESAEAKPKLKGKRVLGRKE